MDDPTAGFDAPVREFVAALRTCRPVELFLAGPMLQVRPAVKGAIALQVFRNRVEVAVDPPSAVPTAATMPGAEVLAKAQRTHLIRVPSAAVEPNFDRLLEVAAAAVDWRANVGPQTTRGAPKVVAEPVPIRRCPRCNMYELQPNGGCPSCDG